MGMPFAVNGAKTEANQHNTLTYRYKPTSPTSPYKEMMNQSTLLAEKALLAAIFATPEIIHDVLEAVKPTDFLEPKNSLIYETIHNLHNSSKSIDPVSIASNIENQGLLNRAGGMEYFHELIDLPEQFTTLADPLGTALVIKEASRKRELADAGATIAQTANAQEGHSADDVLGQAESLIVDILTKTESSEATFNVANLLPEVIRDMEQAALLEEGTTVGIPTGFPEFDEITGGLKGSAMIIVAARPAVGKSTLAVDFARSAAFLADKTVLFFSLEMGAKELAARILSAEARVETTKVKTGRLSPEEWTLVNEARAKLSNSHFYIDANPNLNITRLRAAATRQKLKPEGLDMIVIDYLQLMEATSSSRNASRENLVSEMSRGLKLLAKEFDVPVIVLSQLNRKSEERQDGRPLVSDLRESGSLEQDADMVLLLHRPEAMDPNVRPGETDLIIGKHRGGRTGKVLLTSMLSYSKFVPGTGSIGRDEPDEDGETVAQFGEEEELPW